ncbi:MAG: agmatine deiminase family protein [Proteobacteria bacterium]|nr:agmatine deiminase family protein [Pseudomonadota bacterium]
MSRLRRVLVAVCVIALAHSSAQLGLRLLETPTPPGHMMAAAGGPVTNLGMQFHRTGADVFLPVFGQIFSALSPSTTVQMVVADAEDQAMFEAAYRSWFPDGHGPSVQFAHTNRPITSWMRDRLAVLPATIDRPAVFLAPPAPMAGAGERVHDWTVPWTLADRLGSTAIARETLYQFEGGDLIADEHAAYVAAPLLGRNPDWSPADLVAALETDLGLPVIPIGFDGQPVPEHHIGMFVTPIGQGKVIVADPAAGLGLLNEEERRHGLEVGNQPLQVDTSAALADRFDLVAETLSAQGLDVVRLPLVPSTTPWVWMSYNNVMLEHRTDGLHVFMPTYGVPKVDDAATAVWLAQGAVVHPIDVSALFRYGGSVRCLVAPLSRKDARPRVAGL